ncbi:MAG TPA: ABC transporter ATP-binding protein [Streptosporangiaceae bacterium]|nr:ABC transporter ATP-binding protein [Streptosporangiaceae bacterium]
MNSSSTKVTENEAADGPRSVPPVPAARLVGAVKTYGTGPGAVRALDGVDVAFDPGAFTAVMGPSGSGKSTLLHCCVGLDRLTDGRALIGETELSSLHDRELTLLRRTRVGFVFQAFNLIPSLSARENITLPLDLAGRAPEQGFLDELVAALGLASRLAHRPAELSGGQQQRVAIARALLARPDIVFADEPTGNLDSSSGAEVLAFLRHAAQERGQSIVMVTHDPVAASYADRAVFLSDGRLVGGVAAPTRESVLAELKRVAP